jgi:hypothetical protein
MCDCHWHLREILQLLPSLATDGRANARRAILEKTNEVLASESPLSPLSDSHAGKPSRVGPAPQRSFADVEECGGLADVEELVGIGYLMRPQGFTQ